VPELDRSLTAHALHERLLRERLRWLAIVRQRDFSTWRRVRLPVRLDFLDQVGADWMTALRHRLSSLPEFRIGVDQIEVVALRSCEQEMKRFRSRRTIRCKPHPSTAETADHFATLPVLDNLQCLQWYGELDGVQEPHIIVELAVDPSLDCQRFVKLLCGQLKRKASAGGAFPLGDIVPWQLRRVYEWPVETGMLGDAVASRVVCKPGISDDHVAAHLLSGGSLGQEALCQ